MSPTSPFPGRIGRTWQTSEPHFTPTPTAPRGAPNVVMVVLDDVGFGDLGCYGSEIATPAIDRLARDGLRYRDFHVTASCTPTRACLMTGRNAHAVGMGVIAEWSSGFPGYAGRLSPHAATLPEILREHAYATLAVGKWHLNSLADANPSGPFDQWPLGRGFERWFGFHGALSNQWHPELFEDNHAVAARPQNHLSTELTDRAIRMLRDHQSGGAQRPFLLYVAYGACHWPHHVPPEWRTRYRGRYDEGWDAVRERRFARQLELGIVPPDTRIAPRNPDVPAWSALEPTERRVASRLQEVYSAFLEHTDHEIGRLTAALDEAGVLGDTLLLLMSDNGASDEGSRLGLTDARRSRNYDPETLDEMLSVIDELGSDHAFNHYAMGWAQVSNTPLKWYKKDVHGGGIRAPLVVHWPGHIQDPGAIRPQFHHAIDLLPTILEAGGIEAPAVFRGVEQIPVHGTSLLYTLSGPDAPTRKRVQIFEQTGDRALWADGWKAVCRHTPGRPFEDDRWELYALDRDFAEVDDLALREPARLARLVLRWDEEAERNQVFPLDDREWQRFEDVLAAGARRIYTLYAGTRLDRLSMPDVANRSYTIEAELEGDVGASGVIVACGSRLAGYVLYLDDGWLAYEYVFSRGVRHRMRSPRRISAGRCRAGLRFRRTGQRCGEGALFVEDTEVARIAIPRTWPIHATTGGLRCGADDGSPVGLGYRPPAVLGNPLVRVQIRLGADGSDDLESLVAAIRREQ